MAWLQINYQSNAIFQNTTLNVILPAETMVGMPPRGRNDWKTVYLLHGLSGDSTHWLLNTRLNELAQKTDTCFIMPSGENSYYVDSDAPMSAYSKFIGEDLIEFTRRILPLSHKREETVIAGLSMGGYGAIYNGFRHHETFGHIIALSSAIITGAASAVYTNPMGHGESFYSRIFGNIEKRSEKDPVELAKQIMRSVTEPVDLYFACGYNDTMVHVNRAFKDELDKIGFLYTYEEDEGSHEWPFWEKYLCRGLEHAFGIDIPPLGAFSRLNPFWIEKPD